MQSAEHSTIALVRPPGPRLAEGIVTHLERTEIDLGRARDQWEAYVAALEGVGWRIAVVESADECPDAVFVEDTAVMFDRLAVLTRPGARSRRPEVDGTAQALGRLSDVETVALGAGRLDGGDVLKIDRRAYVGIGGRTDAEGVAALSALLAPRGWEVVGVPVTRVLHLKSAVTALPDGTVIGFEPLVDDPRSFENFLAVPEEDGAHVVVVDEGTVLMADSAPESAALLRARGLAVIEVDISEYIKLEGCVTCLSIRIR